MEKDVGLLIKRLSEEKFDGKKLEWQKGFSLGNYQGASFVEDAENKYFLYNDIIIVHNKDSEKYNCYDCDSPIKFIMTINPAILPKFYCPNCQEEPAGQNVLNKDFIEKALFEDKDIKSNGFFRYRK
ncbi:hypothetical protein KAR52_00185 [Candidatus Pacearchaeota archaeon]|nr:hypothetical protein [Candidatus Pacearchaeota archaeon]